MTKPLISVIIPCYNSEKYLEECIKSVLNQSYQNFEIICVDNNSTDSTYAILQKLQKQNPDKIFLAKEEKQNASAARMNGLSIAKGNIIQFLDADDAIAPEKFERQLEPLIKNEADVVVSDRVDMDQTLHNIVTQHNFKEISTNPINTVLAKIIITGNPLHRRSAIEAINGFDTSLSSSQDLDFHIRLALTKPKFAYVPGTFLLSRLVTGSLSSDFTKISMTSTQVFMNLKSALEKRRAEIKEDSTLRISRIFYDAAIYSTNVTDQKKYLEHLQYWDGNKYQYLSSSLKKLIVKIFGLSFLVRFDAWRLNQSKNKTNRSR